MAWARLAEIRAWSDSWATQSTFVNHEFGILCRNPAELSMSRGNTTSVFGLFLSASGKLNAAESSPAIFKNQLNSDSLLEKRLKKKRNWSAKYGDGFKFTPMFGVKYINLYSCQSRNFMQSSAPRGGKS